MDTIIDGTDSRAIETGGTVVIPHGSRIKTNQLVNKMESLYSELSLFKKWIFCGVKLPIGSNFVVNS